LVVDVLESGDVENQWSKEKSGYPAWLVEASLQPPLRLMTSKKRDNKVGIGKRKENEVGRE
jgi:hypothetical protein